MGSIRVARCARARMGTAAHAAVAAGAEPRVAPSQGAFNLWLLKPVNGHGGEGIEVESEVAALERHLLRARLGSPAFIVQKYIEQPLLYDGRKFDVRLWAAVRFFQLGAGCTFIASPAIFGQLASRRLIVDLSLIHI